MMTPRPSLSAGFLPTSVAEEMFDAVPNIVFFVKDTAGRYVAVNRTLVERCGRRSKRDVIGRTVADFFPPTLAAIYSAQDALVLRTGQRITNKLELHLYANRRSGWCLTSKIPLSDAKGRTIGLAGLSRDIEAPTASGDFPPAFAAAIEALHQDHAGPVALADLARRAGLTRARFSRLVKRIFHLTPRQLLTQVRVQAASARLRDTEANVAEIAHGCGFYDHSAFTRQFKATSGLTPLDYRRMARAARTE